MKALLFTYGAILIIITVTFIHLKMPSLFKQDIQKLVSVKDLNVFTEISYDLCQQRRTPPKRQKVLSYSLFGNGTRHNTGNGDKYRDCIRILSDQAKHSELYRDWFIRVYHDNGIAPDILKEHASNTKLHFCNVEELSFNKINLLKVLGKFWRTLSIADPFVDVTCLRDLDSDLLLREEHAVKQWIESNETIHSMRDHSQHHVGILAGMWCFRNYGNRDKGYLLVEELFDRAKKYASKSDQPLLNKVIYEQLSHDSMEHDSYLCNHYTNSIPFPSQREDNRTFIGCPGHNCNENLEECPIQCRPKEHPDWIYC